MLLGEFLRICELGQKLFPVFFFFWISKNLFPKKAIAQKQPMTIQGAPWPQENRKTDSTSPKTRKGATARNNRHQIPKPAGHAPPKPGKTEEKTKAYPSKKEGKAPTTTPSTTNQTPHSRANKQPTKESQAHTPGKGNQRSLQNNPQPWQRYQTNQWKTQ